jgi:hypothetical protein
MTRAGVAQARIGDGAMARAGEGKRERGDQREDHPSKVTLKVAGDQGTAFSGVCSVGRREEVLEGRTPERRTYDLEGGKLECKIQKASAGTLEVVLTGEGIHAVQRSNAQGGAVRFALSGGSVTSSTSSVYQNQTIESSQESFSDDFR